MQYFMSFLVLQSPVAVIILCLFLRVPWVGLQYVIVVFPCHSHLLFLVLSYIFIIEYHDLDTIPTFSNLKMEFTSWY